MRIKIKYVPRVEMIKFERFDNLIISEGGLNIIRSL